MTNGSFEIKNMPTKLIFIWILLFIIIIQFMQRDIAFSWNTEVILVALAMTTIIELAIVGIWIALCAWFFDMY